jgi:hypothetical protein
LNRIFEMCAGMMFLLAASPGFSQTPATGPAREEITISVYDYARVSTELLAAAEEDARGVFRQAGVETVWATCLPKLEKTQPNDCYTADTTHLMLKILPRAISAQARDRSDVLGAALVDGKGVGYYAYVFYDSVQRVAEERKLGHAVLGDVLAHEIGHLLLGSNSHSLSGIMSAHWSGEDLRRISEAAMLFTPNQGRMLRDRLESHKVDIPFVTRATARSPEAPF